MCCYTHNLYNNVKKNFHALWSLMKIIKRTNSFFSFFFFFEKKFFIIIIVSCTKQFVVFTYTFSVNQNSMHLAI